MDNKLDRAVRPESGRRMFTGSWLRSLIGEVVGMLSVGIIAGGIAGAIAAGLGSRIAMRISGFLADPAAARVMFTENGARVGAITLAGTMFLVVSAAFVGPIGGLLFLATRRWLPQSSWVSQGIVFGLLLLAIDGSVVIDGRNRDFHQFGPAWLNVLMFAALFVLFGVLVAYLVGRFQRVARLRAARFTVQLALLIVMSIAFFGVAVPLLRTMIMPTPDSIAPSQAFLLLVTLALAGAGMLVSAAHVAGGFAHVRQTRTLGYAILAVVGLTGAYFNIQAVTRILQAAAR